MFVVLPLGSLLKRELRTPACPPCLPLAQAETGAQDENQRQECKRMKA